VGFTLIANFIANRFWEIARPDRFIIENGFSRIWASSRDFFW